MTVRSSIDPALLLEEQLAQASPDLLREPLQTFINTLLSAEADSVCGAEYGASSPERVNRRNGYRQRDFDTPAGTLGVAIHWRAGDLAPCCYPFGAKQVDVDATFAVCRERKVGKADASRAH